MMTTTPCLCGANDCRNCNPRTKRPRRRDDEPVERYEPVDHPRGSFWDRYDDNNYDGVCL